MGRIPEVEIERLKREIPVERLAREAGVVLKQHGEELLGLCPFHDDKSPSLVINPSKNLWHCLGACQAGGSVIDWVMREKGLEFRDAVGVLQGYSPSQGNVEMTCGKSPLRNDVPPSPKGESLGGASLLQQGEDCAADSAGSPFDKGGEGDFGHSTETHQHHLKQVIAHYHTTLKQNAEAQAYLEKRGIADAKIIEKFQLGFCDRSFGQSLPGNQVVAGRELRCALQELGILRSSGHEHFRGSLVIPVMDENGVITEVYGRKINSNLRKGTPLHLYLPGPHRGVWNVEVLLHHDEIVLCESLIDALSFYCAGVHNVTCAYGIEGFTGDHLEAFLMYGVKRVFIAYDQDVAGEKAAMVLAKRLREEGIASVRVNFAEGQDANECHVNGGDLKGMMERMIAGIGVASSFPRKRESCEGSLDPRLRGDDVKCRNNVNLSDDVKCRNNVNLSDDGKCGDVVSLSDDGKSPSFPRMRESCETIKGEYRITLGERSWRIRGIERNMSFDVLRVNVLVAQGEIFHVDTFDLYNARHRTGYIKQAAAELGLKEEIIKKDLGKVFLKLEELQEKQIRQTLSPKEEQVHISATDRIEAMKLLEDPKLLDRILEDFEKCGVVGEQNNKLVGYLAACSRKLEKPLAIVIQSSSAAGKSSLMEAILSFLPGEEQVKYSAMTGQSLFYMGETNLKHKILAIAEEEGAERASYALKLLQSEGELTIASTGKDPATGRLETQEYHVEGPVMIFLTTTAIEIDEELLNRCIVLSVDEDRAQTRAIHALQRESQTLEGLLANREKDGIIRLHQNAQRLLRPLLVANPFAKSLTFLDNRTRTRRDHMKYLTLIRSIALLHQYQREIKTVKRNGQGIEYIEVTPDDIGIANRLSHQVLGRSLDELSPQTRRLLIQLDEMVSAMCEKHDVERCDVRFSRRQVREFTGFGFTQTRIHLDRLVELEYLVAHHGARGQSFEYELVFDGDPRADATQFMGLIDVKTIKTKGTTTTWRGDDVTWRGHGGPKTGGWRSENRQVISNDYKELSKPNGKTLKNAHLEAENQTSYIVRPDDGAALTVKGAR